MATEVAVQATSFAQFQGVGQMALLIAKVVKELLAKQAADMAIVTTVQMQMGCLCGHIREDGKEEEEEYENIIHLFVYSYS